MQLPQHLRSKIYLWSPGSYHVQRARLFPQFLPEEEGFTSDEAVKWYLSVSLSHFVPLPNFSLSCQIDLKKSFTTLISKVDRDWH